MNLWQKITGLFSQSHGPVAPSELQVALDAAGKIVDEIETLFEQFSPLVSQLPPQFKGFLSALAIALHSLDQFLDTIETQSPAPAPAPAPAQEPPAK